MNCNLTKHAQEAMRQREIPAEWLKRTLSAPELIQPDPDDPDVERYFKRIPEFGGRVLRVAVNTSIDPPRVITVFFDRQMKDQL